MDAVNGEYGLVMMFVVEDDRTVLHSAQVVTVTGSASPIRFDRSLAEQWRRRWDANTRQLGRKVLLNFERVGKLQPPFAAVAIRLVLRADLVVRNGDRAGMKPDNAESLLANLE